MNEIRCGACNKLLGTGLFTLVKIKCPRCKALHCEKRAESPVQSERRRASNPIETPHALENTSLP